MIREHKIKKIYNDEKDKSSKLAIACKRFLDFHTSYRSGKGDVIYGLKELDRLEEKVEQLLK